MEIEMEIPKKIFFLSQKSKLSQTYQTKTFKKLLSVKRFHRQVRLNFLINYFTNRIKLNQYTGCP